MENSELRSFGDGSVREQWRAYAWCFTGRSNAEKFSIRKGCVHGHRNQMKALRAEASYVLSVLCLIYTIQDFTSCTGSIEIHTDCQGLINKVNDKNIN